MISSQLLTQQFLPLFQNLATGQKTPLENSHDF